jgi:hypothetical protein
MLAHIRTGIGMSVDNIRTNNTAKGIKYIVGSPPIWPSRENIQNLITIQNKI